MRKQTAPKSFKLGNSSMKDNAMALRKQFLGMSLDELADELETQDLDHPYHRAAMAEFMFRQAEAQERSALRVQRKPSLGELETYCVFVI